MTRVTLAIIAGVKDLAAGVKYVYGAKPSLLGPVKTSDCSGAIRRWAAQAGVRMLQREGRGTCRIEDWSGSWTQREWCTPVSVAYALSANGIGCLLFIRPKGERPGHVALSLGGGWTLECRGGRGVCVVGPAENKTRGWTDGGKLPELFELPTELS